MKMSDWCETFFYLRGKPIRFAGRPYLRAVYDTTARRQIVCAVRGRPRKARTWSTASCTRPGPAGQPDALRCPAWNRPGCFSPPAPAARPGAKSLPAGRLLGRGRRRPQVMNLVENGATLFVRAAYHSADSCRGLSVDLLLVDEFQDVAEGDLPVLTETLSHAENGRMVLTGTPKLCDNHLEAMFRRSTANEWTTACPNCGKDAILDERCLGPSGYPVPAVRNAAGSAARSLGGPQSGRPGGRDSGSAIRWCPGCPTTKSSIGSACTTGRSSRTRSWACRRRWRAPRHAGGVGGVLPRRRLWPSGWRTCHDEGRGELLAGIDWGGGQSSRTVLAIGFMRRDYCFQVCLLERFAASEDPDHVLASVAQRCAQFRVRLLAADGGGNGHVLNRLLLDRLGRTGTVRDPVFGGRPSARIRTGCSRSGP